MNRIIDNNPKVIKVANRELMTSVIIGFVFGIGLVVFGFLADKELPGSYLLYLFGVIGSVILILSVIRLARSQRYPTSLLDENRK